MDNEITRITNLIKDTTGKSVTVFKRDSSSLSGGEDLLFKRDGVEYACRIDGECDTCLKDLIIALLENCSLGEAPVGKSVSLKNVLLGEANEITVQKYVKEYGVHDVPCAVFVVYSQAGKTSDLLDFLDNFKTEPNDLVTLADDSSCAYVRFQEGVNVDGEYKSLTDYACLLAQSINEELGVNVKIGVGGVVDSFKNCSVSYKQALIALRMGDIFENQASVSTYKEYLLVKMLEDMPKYKLQEYLDVLVEPEARSVLNDPEMLATAEEFLHTSLNVSETSRNLYMHRNTLMYRLDKIERATGLDIRKFQDAMTFRLIMILYKLVV